MVTKNKDITEGRGVFLSPALVVCDCADWKKGIEELKKCIVISTKHGEKYEGGLFRWCPWCGKKLKSERTEDEEFK